MLDLQLLSNGLRKRLVIGQFTNVTGDGLAEFAGDVPECRVRVLDDVMQKSSDDRILVRDISNIDQQTCDLERMIDVRLTVAALSFLAGVLFRGVRGRADDPSRLAHDSILTPKGKRSTVLALTFDYPSDI